MVNEYKKIVLLSGLQSLSDYHFRVVKSLLIPDLQLNKKMQDDYDRVKIADLMEEKFQSDAGLSILIELCQDIPELGDLVDTLRKKMEKVKNKSQRKDKHVGPKQDESCTFHLSSNTKEDFELEPTMKTPSPEKREDTITKSPDIMTAESFQGEHKLPELSATNRCQAMREPQTPQRLPTTASSSLQTPLEPPEISYTGLTAQGPSALFSTSDKISQVSSVTASSRIHTTQVNSLLSYRHQDPLKSPKTVPSSVPALQASPVTVTSNTQASWIPQATVHRSVQTSQVTPATMISGCKSPQVSAATVSGSYNTPQVTPATAHRSVQASWVTPATMTVIIRVLSCLYQQCLAVTIPLRSQKQCPAATKPLRCLQQQCLAVTIFLRSPQQQCPAVSSLPHSLQQHSPATAVLIRCLLQKYMAVSLLLQHPQQYHSRNQD